MRVAEWTALRRDRAEAADKLSAVMAVEVRTLFGQTKCAAVSDVAREKRASPSTIWRWLAHVKGVHPCAVCRLRNLASSRLRIDMVRHGPFCASAQRSQKELAAFEARRRISKHLNALRARHPGEPTDAR